MYRSIVSFFVGCSAVRAKLGCLRRQSAAVLARNHYYLFYDYFFFNFGLFGLLDAFFIFVAPVYDDDQQYCHAKEETEKRDYENEDLA